MTNPEYQVYKGVDFTATKRYSNRWQAAIAVTIQDNPFYFPAYSGTYAGLGGIGNTTNNNPNVSTKICRFRPLIFLPAS